MELRDSFKDYTPAQPSLLKVVGAGFGRTGTASLKVALGSLGFGPCYHMTEVFEHPEHAAFWLAAWRDEPVDWDGLLGGYASAVDWPACSFYGSCWRGTPTRRCSSACATRSGGTTACAAPSTS